MFFYVTDYTGNYIYKNDQLQFFTTAEGYATPEGTGYRYVYQFKDHLGNTRLSYTKNDSGNLEIIEENNYYPFGLTHKGYNNIVSSLGNSTAQNYKYQGQELNENLGYNMYEFELRHYDATIGRFVTTDPYEQFMSPYLAMGNNPVVSFDPDGGFCKDANGNTIACPDGAGDLYDDVKDSETNHIEILDEAIVGGDDSSSSSTDDQYAFHRIRGQKVAPAIGELRGWDKFSAEAHENMPWLFGKRTSDDGRLYVDPSGNSTGLVPIGAEPINVPFGPGGAKSTYTVIKQGTKAWKEAVNSIRNLKKANFRVSTAHEAKALLKEAFGNMNRVTRYKKLPSGSPQAAKRYEVHNLDKINSAREIGVGNDLNHIKYTNGKQSGHIFFGK